MRRLRTALLLASALAAACAEIPTAAPSRSCAAWSPT